MSRAVTAIYRTYAVADLVRDEIAALGVGRSYIHVIPEHDDGLAAGSYRDDHALDEVHDLHLPEDDVRTYQQAVRRGDYVVSANVDDDHLDRVMDIMRRPEDSYDIDETEREFADADYLPPRDYGAAGYGAGAGEYGDRVEGEQSIPVVEERLTVGKRETGGGSVHVRTYVHEVPVEERIRLRNERVDIRRQATGERVLTGAEAEAAFQERDIVMEEHREEAVVGKEAVVTEEVVVWKDVDTEERVVRDTVRRTEVDVDRDHDR